MPITTSLFATLIPADTARQLVPNLNLSFGHTQPRGHHQATSAQPQTPFPAHSVQLTPPGILCPNSISLLAAFSPADTTRQLVPNLNLSLGCTQPSRQHQATCAQPQSPFRAHSAQLTPPGNLCPTSISPWAALSPADTTRQLVPNLNLPLGHTQPS